MKHNRNTQAGATAMLTVIFLALLLSIITLSFVRLSVTEQRQASDDALTTRAYYAAESGLEDAKRALVRLFDGDASNDPIDLNEPGCKPAEIQSGDPVIDTNNNAVLSDELATYYTCQFISMTPPDFQAELAAWESVTIPLVNASGTLEEVLIEWHQKGPDPYNGDYNLVSPGGDLPTFPGWTGAGYCPAGGGAANPGCPAMLRANFFSTESSGNLTRDEFDTVTTFLRPATANSGAPSDIGDPIFNKSIKNIFCKPFISAGDGEYVCSATFDGLDTSRRNYLHINSLYRATNIKVSLLDSGNPIPMEGAQAIIDVTGRAGDVFRRIEARVALTQLYPLPDYAIWANEEICKHFDIAGDDDDPGIYTGSNVCQWAP